MEIFRIIYIIFIVAFLWLMKLLYRTQWDEEFKEKIMYRNLAYRITKDNIKLINLNIKLEEENKKLKEKLNKSKNRVAKVVKEEKADE